MMYADCIIMNERNSNLESPHIKMVKDRVLNEKMTPINAI